MKIRIVPYLLVICTVVLMGCSSKDSSPKDHPDTASEVASETKADVGTDEGTSSVDTVPSPPTIQLQYLKGTSDTTSPDGSVPYEMGVEVLVKRTIDHANNTITEESWHGQEHRITYLTLREGTLIFDSIDKDETFGGTMTFETKDWAHGSVVYDIKMLDGSGSLSGTGVWEGQTYKTDKLFSDASENPKAKIVEILNTISEEDYLASVPN